MADHVDPQAVSVSPKRSALRATTMNGAAGKAIRRPESPGRATASPSRRSPMKKAPERAFPRGVTRCSVTGKLAIPPALEKPPQLMPTLSPPEVEVDDCGEALEALRVATPTTAPRSTVRGRATVAAPDLSPEELVWKRNEQLEFVRSVMEKIRPMLPQEGAFNDAVDAKSPTKRLALVEREEDEASKTKINVHLYKNLIVAKKVFCLADCREGEALVGQAFDMLLKLRLKRVHTSLLKTNFAAVVDAMSVEFPAVKHSAARRRVCVNSGLLPPTLTSLAEGCAAACEVPKALQLPPFSAELLAAIELAQRIGSVEDALVKPCDTDEYMGVIDYAERTRSRVAELVVNENVIVHTVECIKSVSKQDSPSAVAFAERLWSQLVEAFHLCFTNYGYPKDLARIVKDSRVIGIILNGLIGQAPTSPLIKRASAQLLHRLVEGATCRDAVTEIVSSFPVALQYLLKALYTNDATVRLEVASAIEMLLAVPQAGEYADFDETVDPSSEELGRMTIIAQALFEMGSTFAEVLQTVSHLFSGTACVLRVALSVARFSKVTGYSQFVQEVLSAVERQLLVMLGFPVASIEDEMGRLSVTDVTQGRHSVVGRSTVDANGSTTGNIVEEIALVQFVAKAVSRFHRTAVSDYLVRSELPKVLRFRCNAFAKPYQRSARGAGVLPGVYTEAFSACEKALKRR